MVFQMISNGDISDDDIDLNDDDDDIYNDHVSNDNICQ